MAVRHGQTAWNAEHRFQGWADVPINQLGQEQAAAGASVLARELEGQTVTLASSDLMRAVGTARIIAAALGVPFDTSSQLREVDVGTWQGLTAEQVAAVDLETYERWSAGDDVRRGEGETRAEAGRRVAADLVERIGSVQSSALVVVGHGISLEYGLNQLAQLGVLRLDGPVPHLTNAEHRRFDARPDAARAVRLAS